MEITKREVIASITIIAVWICIGLAIAGKINDWQQDKNAEYDRAARIVQQDLLRMLSGKSLEPVNMHCMVMAEKLHGLIKTARENGIERPANARAEL